MRPSIVVLTCALAVSAAPAAQQPTAVETAAAALGAANVRSLQFTGSGRFFAVGQSASPAAPWPRFTMRAYTAAINYETGSMRVDFVRAQAENPPRGGGNQPLAGDQRQILVVSGTHAWNVPPPPVTPQTAPGATPAPQPQPAATAEERMLQIHLTPHGFLKGALAAGASTRLVRGATEATYTVGGRHRVVGTINARNQVERVQTWLEHPVLGEMLYEAIYSGYREFGGVLFPASIVIRQGGHPVFDIAVATVQANLPVDIAVPDVARAAAPPPRVEVDKVAEGVFYLTGGTHHSVAVEMRDHVVVIEGPQNEARANAVIARVKELLPGKPIRFVVNTHHHFDHSGGLGPFVEAGATVVTHQINRPFYEKLPWAKGAAFQAVAGRGELGDGTRTIELHHVAGNGHNEGMLMAYLPRERILVEADVFTVNAPNQPAPAAANPFSVNLYENLQRLKLEPVRILGLHGRATDMSELRRLIRRRG